MAEQLVLVYAGIGYTPPTVAQLNSLVNVNGLVLIPGNFASPHNQKYIYGNTTNNATVTANAVNAVVDFINNIWLKTTMAQQGWGKLYIGTPHPDNAPATYTYMDQLYPTYRDYIEQIRNRLGNTLFYSQQFPGVYMNLETIYPHSTAVSTASPTSNPTIKLFNDLSYNIRTTHGKQFIWAPYYGSGTNAANIIHNIGIVVNRMNLFDTCYMQPNYYFNQPSAPTHINAPYANLTGVQASMQKQVVCYRDGVPAAGGRLATATLTRIGAVMELDSNIYRENPLYYGDNRYPYARWREYVSTFNTLENLNQYPFLVYAGAAGSLFSDPYKSASPGDIKFWNSVQNEIRDFFA